MARTGRPRVVEHPSRAVLLKLYTQERRSIRDIAAALGCKKDVIHRSLAEYGIEARSQGEKRSALQDVPLARLRALVASLGLRGAARELGVDHGNLARHLKAREQ